MSCPLFSHCDFLFGNDFSLVIRNYLIEQKIITQKICYNWSCRVKYVSVHLHNDRVDGTYKTPELTRSWKFGRKHGRQEYCEYRHLLHQEHYKSNQKHGVTKWWHTNGQLYHQSLWQNGGKVGNEYWWNYEGRKVFTCIWKNYRRIEQIYYYNDQPYLFLCDPRYD